MTYGCITASSKNVWERIEKIRSEIGKLFQNNDINKILLQEVIPQFNSHTSKVLIWLQAAVILKIRQINPEIEIEFLGTSSWRTILKMKQGRGIKRQTLKKQDIQYVKNKYNFIVNDDQADAICLFDSYWINKFSQKEEEINWK